MREIIYCRETRDYEMYLHGVFVGYARSNGDAEKILDQLAIEWASHPHPDTVHEYRETQAQTADIEADLAAESELSDALPTSIEDGEYTFDVEDVKDVYALLLAHPDLQTVRWQRALDRAYDLLYLSQFNIAIANGALLYTSESSEVTYRTTVQTCTCKAGQSRAPCKHRAAVLIAATIISHLRVAVAA